MAALSEAGLGIHPDQIKAREPKAGAAIVEFRHPLRVTRESLDALPRAERLDQLKTLRWRGRYNPEYAEKLGEVFPEGETQFPLSFLEQRFFDAGTQVMADPAAPLTKSQTEAFGLAHGLNPEETASAFREEARLRESMDMLTARFDIGGYHMGRHVVRELDRRIDFDIAVARDLEAAVSRFGTEAYLSPSEKALLKRVREERAMQTEYERSHPHKASLSEGDKAALRRTGTKIQ
jgi:hypothetical protein